MPQLQSFKQPMLVARPSREVMTAIVFSIVMHLFPALILWIVATNRIVVESSTSSISTPLFVSLTTLPDSSHDMMDIKEISPMPATDLPIQNSQSFTQRTSIVYNKSEADTIVKSEDLAAPASVAPEGNPLATDANPLFDLEAPYRMERDFGKIPEFKIDTFVTTIGEGVPGSESFGDKSLTTYLTASYGLEAVNRFEQVFGEMSEDELQIKRLEWRIDYIKKYEASLPPDCLTAYAGAGLFAVPLLIKDAITGDGCKW